MTRDRDGGGDQERDELARRLDALADEERAAMEEAARMKSAPGDDDVERTLRSAMGSPAPDRGRRRRTTTWSAVAAAAATLVIALLATRGDDGPGPGDDLLGAPRLELASPAAGPGAFDRIAWTFPDAPGATFRVTVTAKEAATELLLEPALTMTSLSLDPERTSTWPDEIVLEIVARDAAGAALDSLRVRLSRSP